MQDLVQNINSELKTTTLAIAEGTGVQHKNVLELTKTHKESLELFGPLAFQTRKGTPLPQGGFAKATEYALLNQEQATLLMTFMRNSEIVIQFKVRLVKAFSDMAKELARTSNAAKTYEVNLAAAEVAARMLNISESGKIEMLGRAIELSGGDKSLLPKYSTTEDNREARAASHLLKEHGILMSVIMFNRKALNAGFLEIKTRPSTKTTNKLKEFKAVSEKGLAYGKNVPNPKNERETSILWYKDKFMDLLSFL